MITSDTPKIDPLSHQSRKKRGGGYPPPPEKGVRGVPPYPYPLNLRTLSTCAHQLVICVVVVYASMG